MAALNDRPLSRAEWRRTLKLISVTVLIVTIVLIVLMPHGRSGEPANRIKCSSNLRQVGLAIKMYANDHGGMYPPTLGVVLATQEITSDVFVCPQSKTETRAELPIGRSPASMEAGNAKQISLGRQIDDPNGHHTSYLYAGDGLNDNTVDPDDVLGFEMPSDHDEDGINMLYADGHVDWMAVGHAGPGRLSFEQFLADFKAQKRPLRDWATPTTKPANPQANEHKGGS